MPIKIIKTLDIPPQVSVQDLGDIEEGRLIAAEETERLKKSLSQDEDESKRYSKKQVGSPYGVIKEQDGTLYAVYKGEKHGKHLGLSRAKVKLVQNLETGKWQALKVAEGASLDKENAILNALGKSKGRVAKRKVLRDGHSKLQSNFVTEYAKGLNLYDYIMYYSPSSAQCLLDIAIKAAESIEEIHRKEYLHRDIHLENLIYDPLSKKVTVVDFGYSQKMTPGRDPAAKQYNVGKLPLEELIHFTDRYSDIYFLGKLLKQLFGISFLVDKWKIKMESTLSTDIELKKMLAQMTDPNHANRPSLEIIIKKLKALRQ